MDPVAVTDNPGIWLALWYVTWSWVLLIYPVFHLLLVFPGGRLLSARWRWVVGVEVAMVAFMVGSVTFAGQLALVDDNDQVVWSLDNPIGFIPKSFFQEAFGLVPGRRRHLGETNPARLLIDQDQVRERAADVDPGHAALRHRVLQTPGQFYRLSSLCTQSI